MSFVGGDPSGLEPAAMAEVAFNPEQRAIWRKASGSDKGVSGGSKQWDAERLSAFQQAVEQRTFWLYRCFYDELGFERWAAAATQADQPAPAATHGSVHPPQETFDARGHPTAAATGG